ncbi:hypothetical protein CUZ56_01345 [Saezia sanguinis]|uniref:Helicase n=1 Tax=Saezia sanguinis TaxID=1965230 RepID=A0A433SFA1_9BURK|nr:MobH family relaxase [Saezia sanguinis]RUS67400.1 hypothetical protein CUZ56_01345 [Saezia sanguinis]
MLLSFVKKLFHPPSIPPLAPPPSVEIKSRFIVPQSANALLATPRRDKILSHIWQRTSVSRTQFDLLYVQPIKRYASLVQQFPASESHHHAYSGGMLDHGLEIIAYALKLRQSHLLPVGSSPETQSAQADAWTAGIAYAALLHDIGKIAVDLHVECKDGQIWHPWNGPLSQPYRFSYKKDRQYRLHSAASGLLYTEILDSFILDWLSRFPELWSSFLFVMAGQNEHAGILGELVVKADQASVAQELGGDPAKALTTPKHALQRKLLDGLRFLLKDSLKLNQPQASDGWLTNDALWLVSKTVSDKLRAHLLAQGIDGIPSSNTAVFNVLQEHGIAQPTPDDKAIWSATVNNENGWSNTFTFLKIAPTLIWQQSDERPAPFVGTVTPKLEQPIYKAAVQQDTMNVVSTSTPPPASPVEPHATTAGLNVVFDLLEDVQTDEGVSEQPVHTDHATVPETTPKNPSTNAVESSGESFNTWLLDSILSRKITINEPKALVHTVADTIYIVSPGIFHRYVQEFPEIRQLAKAQGVQDWRYVQRQFERTKVHKKQANGLNIWTCLVTGPRKTRRVHGYLLRDPSTILPEIPFNNPYLEVIEKESDPSFRF